MFLEKFYPFTFYSVGSYCGAMLPFPYIILKFANRTLIFYINMGGSECYLDLIGLDILRVSNVLFTD